MKAFKVILMILNMQILGTLLWIAFGDYEILVYHTDELWNRYLMVSMFVVPTMNIIYFIVSLMKKEKLIEKG